MTTDLQYLASSTVLTFVMLLGASLLKARGWTPAGFLLALSNRDHMPEPSPMAMRADRAGRNMLENMVLFIAALVFARFGGAEPAALAQGCAIFFWARLAYCIVYVAGIPYVRTLLWAIAVYGMVELLRAVH